MDSGLRKQISLKGQSLDQTKVDIVGLNDWNGGVVYYYTTCSHDYRIILIVSVEPLIPPAPVCFGFPFTNRKRCTSYSGGG